MRRMVEGFNEKEYRSHLDATAFMWMIYWSVRSDHQFQLDKTINYWWTRAYIKPFPQEGGTAADLVDRIYVRLIDRGHDSRRIEPEESDYELPDALVKQDAWN